MSSSADDAARGTPSPVAWGLQVPHRTLVLLLVTASQFLIVLDYTIVQIALPSIQTEFGLSVGAVQWVLTAYGLTVAGFLLLSGRAGDVYGHRRLFLAGLLIFSFMSLVAGFAPSPDVLIGARVVQGIGAAMGSSGGLSILVATFPEGRERNRALGIMGSVLGSGFIMGMISGGLITSFAGWRWVFGVTVPVGFAATALSARFVPSPPRATNKGGSERLDFPGAVTVTAGLMLLVYALTNVESAGLGSVQTTATFALAALALGSFVLLESRTERPLLPLAFIRRRSVFTANAVALVTLASFVGMIFMLTYYLQEIVGYSPLITGLSFAPAGLVFFTVSGFMAARLINRVGLKRVLVAGEALAVVGYLLLVRVSPTLDYFSVALPATALVALGVGLAFPAYSIAALMGAKRGEEGLASGILNTSRQVGGPIGVAVLITLASTLADPPPSVGVGQLVNVTYGFQVAFAAASAIALAATLLASAFRHEGDRAIEIPPPAS